MKRPIRAGWEKHKCYGTMRSYAWPQQRVACPGLVHKPHMVEVPIWCGCHCHSEGYCCRCEKEDQSV